MADVGGDSGEASGGRNGTLDWGHVDNELIDAPCTWAGRRIRPMTAGVAVDWPLWIPFLCRRLTVGTRSFSIAREKLLDAPFRAGDWPIPHNAPNRVPKHCASLPFEVLVVLGHSPQDEIVD